MPCYCCLSLISFTPGKQKVCVGLLILLVDNLVNVFCCVAEEEKGLVCQCEGCLTKRVRLQAEKPKRWLATTLRSVDGCIVRCK